MSSRTLGVFPKSGEQMLKDAIGQFKGIITQIGNGIKKVAAKMSDNTKESDKLQLETKKKTDKLQVENERMVAAVAEAEIVMANLQAILSGKLVILPTTEESVDEDKPEDTTSEESK